MILTNPPVIIRVCEIDRNKVRLGIDADRSVRVMRLELLTAEQLQALDAAMSESK